MEEHRFPGKKLRECRIEKGLSRGDVYRKLRIPIDIITALEEGNVPALPSLPYTTGFIKTYCAYLEISPEPYIDAILAATRPTRRFIRLSEAAPKRPAWLQEAAMWAGIVGIILLGWLTYSFVFHPESSPKDTQVQADTMDLRDIPRIEQ